MRGAVIGGIVLGVAEKLLGFYVTTVFIEVTGYLVPILVLMLRPQGLFGHRAAARLSSRAMAESAETMSARPEPARRGPSRQVFWLIPLGPLPLPCFSTRTTSTCQHSRCSTSRSASASISSSAISVCWRSPMSRISVSAPTPAAC